MYDIHTLRSIQLKYYGKVLKNVYSIPFYVDSNVKNPSGCIGIKNPICIIHTGKNIKSINYLLKYQSILEIKHSQYILHDFS